ncbi:MAG: OmpH family outer membrane protein [Alphaproteobacteria bacterium]|nr:OmpH family outer membrane protein [Alphaproteobacteria bacterium]
MNKGYIKIETVLIIVLYIVAGYMYHLISSIKNIQQTNSVQTIKAMETQINENKKIYIYNLEGVLRKINAVDEKVQMEEKILKLNNELMEAEKKIKSLKNAQVKEDFSDMYLKNLRMKRDEILENYEKSLGDITDRINSALNEIAKEKNVSTIFVHSVISVKTPYVVDVTDEVAAKILQ